MKQMVLVGMIIASTIGCGAAKQEGAAVAVPTPPNVHIVVLDAETGRCIPDAVMMITGARQSVMLTGCVFRFATDGRPVRMRVGAENYSGHAQLIFPGGYAFRLARLVKAD